jgi:cytochrome c-type biogenesis protein CcmH
MAFWLAALAMAVGVAALLARAMLRDDPAGREATDLDVYRDQLSEVERDRERGLIDATEAERLRVEVSRRLLEADRKARSRVRAGDLSRPGAFFAAGMVVIAVFAGSVLLYGGSERLLRQAGFSDADVLEIENGERGFVMKVITFRGIGSPGYPDLPIERRIAMAEEARKNRPSQEAAEARAAIAGPAASPEPRHAELMQQLRSTLEERPNDLQGHILLARNEASLGNFVAARKAQRRVVDIKGDGASAADWADLALLLTYAADGYVSPEAEAAIAEVLRRDPTNGSARYLSGVLYVQTGRPDLAFRLWRPLLEQSTPDEPWYAPIRARIEDVAQLAGVDYRAPRPVRGPSEEDMAAAADMEPEDQQAMIRGMVEGLAGRLAESGGPAEDWARLITALGVLGETDRATAIYAEALEAFEADAEDLALIEGAGRRAGVAE